MNQEHTPQYPVKEYRDGLIDEIAVHYVKLSRVVEEKAKRNKHQEDNVRSAELDFLLDLETLIEKQQQIPTLLQRRQQYQPNTGRL